MTLLDKCGIIGLLIERRDSVISFKLYAVAIHTTEDDKFHGMAHTGKAQTPAIYDALRTAQRVASRRNNARMSTELEYRAVELQCNIIHSE